MLPHDSIGGFSRWTLRGWFSSAVVLTVFGLLAPHPLWSAATQDPAKDEKKQDKGPKVDPGQKKYSGFPDIEAIIKMLPPNLPAEQVDRIRKSLEQARRNVEAAQKQAELLQRQFPGVRPIGPGGFWFDGANRLGVRVEKPTATLIAQLGLAEGKGLVLAQVHEGAAAKAGLKVNDILLELNGKEVSNDLNAFSKSITDIKAGTPFDAVVLRKGKKETVKGITLPEPPQPFRPPVFQFQFGGENRLGVRLDKPSMALIVQLGLAAGKGLVLGEVREGSAAAKAGLKTSDILLELSGKEVPSNMVDFLKQLNDIKTGTPVDVVVLRKGKKETIKGITLPDVPPQPRPFRFEPFPLRAPHRNQSASLARSASKE